MIEGHILTTLPIQKESWEFESSWALRQDDGILALAWVQEQPIIALLCMDVETGKVVSQEKYRCESALVGLWVTAGQQRGSWLLAWRGASSAARVRRGSRQQRGSWLLAWRGDDTAERIEQMVFLPLRMNQPSRAVDVDQAADSMSSAGMALLADQTPEGYNLLYFKPSLDDIDPASIKLAEIAVQAESMHVTTREIEWAVKASAYSEKDCWYLILFDAQWEKLGKVAVTAEDFKGAEPIWRFFIVGGKAPLTKGVWKYRLNMGVFATADPQADFWRDVTVGAAAIAGPRWSQEQKRTLVVGAAIFKNIWKLLSDRRKEVPDTATLVCLSEDGEVVAQCQDLVGERLSLGRCGETIIGVDRLEGRWRRWTWNPLHRAQHLEEPNWLDEEVRYAYVVSNQQIEEQELCWIIEEYAQKLVVTRYNGATLSERGEVMTVTGLHLLHKDEEHRYTYKWDWPQTLEIIPYKSALTFLAVDEKDQLVLYQIK